MKKVFNEKKGSNIKFDDKLIPEENLENEGNNNINSNNNENDNINGLNDNVKSNVNYNVKNNIKNNIKDNKEGIKDNRNEDTYNRKKEEKEFLKIKDFNNENINKNNPQIQNDYNNINNYRKEEFRNINEKNINENNNKYPHIFNKDEDKKNSQNNSIKLINFNDSSNNDSRNLFSSKNYSPNHIDNSKNKINEIPNNSTIKNERTPELSPIKVNENSNLIQTPDVLNIINKNKKYNNIYIENNERNIYNTINEEKEIQQQKSVEPNYKIMDINYFSINNIQKPVNNKSLNTLTHKNKFYKDLTLIHQEQNKQIKELEKRKQEIDERKKEILKEKKGNNLINKSNDSMFKKLVKISKSTEKLVNDQRYNKYDNLDNKKNSYISIFDEQPIYQNKTNRSINKTPDINLISNDKSQNNIFTSEKNSINSSRLNINQRNNSDKDFFKNYSSIQDNNQYKNKEKYLNKLKEEYKHRKIEEKIQNAIKQKHLFPKKETKSQINILYDNVKYQNKFLIEGYLMPPNKLDMVIPKAHFLYSNKGD